MENVDLFTYANTLGSVNRETSKKRTTREQAWKNAEQVINLLHKAGTYGMTWKQLGHITGLHHGQISGLLSNMHRAGLVAQLRIRRDGCHPYIAAHFIPELPNAEVFIEPVTTQAGRVRTRLNLLMDLLEQCSEDGWVGESLINLQIQYKEMVKEIENERKR